MYGTKFLIANRYCINNVVREDSQIDFATGKVSLHVWEGGGGGGGGAEERFRHNLAIINIFKQRNYRKNLVSK